MPSHASAPHDATRGALCGLGDAALFGASTPISKILLTATGPLLLAALLYLGAGVAVTMVGLLPGEWGAREARIRRSDLGWLSGIVLLGGIIGPVLMLYGLSRVCAVVGSLLLNLEAPFTMLLATLLFREHLGRRAAVAATVIVSSATLMSHRPGELSADWRGVLSIAGACLCWALDNNFTQHLSLRNPIAVVRIKALTAGTGTLLIAIGMGARLPGPAVIAAALALGAVAYGISIVLDLYALRFLGSAREAALFATSPFIGALLAVPVLGERLGRSDLLAMGLMAVGVLVLVRERHGHVHSHEVVEHDHLHVHDEHHQHDHGMPGLIVEPHAHPHREGRLTHDHPHVPDLHHRHKH